MIIGITGYKGRLGAQLVSMPNCVPLVCDITKFDEVRDVIKSEKPDVIVNCAAFTGVDGAETEFEKAMAVNSRGVATLRDMFDGRLIHISTDYVFDGKSGPYRETLRRHAPFNAYGWSKAGGEIICWYYRPELETILVRTTGLYGGISGRPDFASMVLDCLENRKKVLISNELCGNQTYVPHLAEALHKLAQMDLEHIYISRIAGMGIDQYRRVFHIASEEIVSRYNFALQIANEFGYDSSCIFPALNSDIKEWVAHRPTMGGLLSSRSVRSDLPIYSIADGLRDYREKMK